MLPTKGGSKVRRSPPKLPSACGICNALASQDVLTIPSAAWTRKEQEKGNDDPPNAIRKFSVGEHERLEIGPANLVGSSYESRPKTIQSVDACLVEPGRLRPEKGRRSRLHHNRLNGTASRPPSCRGGAFETDSKTKERTSVSTNLTPDHRATARLRNSTNKMVAGRVMRSTSSVWQCASWIAARTAVSWRQGMDPLQQPHWSWRLTAFPVTVTASLAACSNFVDRPTF
jgi:hypothetical protein